MSDEDSKEEVVLQKPKRAMKPKTEEQKEVCRKNLAKAREAKLPIQIKAKEEKQILIEENKIMVEKKVVEKAAKILKSKAIKENKIDKLLGNTDEFEIEEHVTIKPKKKKIIYREESDSEEEEVIVKTKRTVPKVREVVVPIVSKPAFKINFV